MWSEETCQKKLLRRCVVDAFLRIPMTRTGNVRDAIGMMLIAMGLSSAVSGSGSELRLAASCIAALSKY